jgi:hypothetical protein
VLIVPLLVAPVLMLAAVRAEQLRGASTGGWVAALPVSMPVGIATIAVESGPHVAAQLAWSAAGHVPAQVLFGAVFAGVLRRAGPIRGFAAGLAAYATASVLLIALPGGLAAPLALPAILLAARRVRPGGSSGSGTPARPGVTAITCGGAGLVVAVTVLGSRAAGPEVGGAFGACPTVSALLALSVVRRSGRAAGADVLAGLVRSLPCYVAFCVCAASTLPGLGLPAIPLALLGCVAVGGVTWRSVATPVPAPA